ATLAPQPASARYLLANDRRAVRQRLELHPGDEARQRPHAAVGGQVDAVGRDDLDDLADPGGDVLGGLDLRRADVDHADGDLLDGGQVLEERDVLHLAVGEV